MYMENRIIVFNHYYRLKHDLKRTYLYSKKKIEYLQSKVPVDTLWLTKIHPIYAMLFSLASEPIELKEYIAAVADFLEVSSLEAESLVLPFLDRDEPFYSEYGNVVSQFPRNLIINAENLLDEITLYSPLDFCYQELDMKTERALFAPQTMVIMPNNNCTTDCAYCYADRSIHPQQMDFKYVKAIVEECKHLKMMDISITGGDIFLYRHWKELLELLNVNGFGGGLLSTKTPLNQDHVDFLKKYSPRLQFSLDSIDPIVCEKLIGMNPVYLNKVKKTFEIFEHSKFPFKVATVLTNLNGDVKYLTELYDFLSNFDTLEEWEIRLASKSLYSKKNFDELNISKDKMQELNAWIESIRPISKIKMIWDTSDVERYFKSSNGSKGFLGARCSANFSNIMVLPNGKVTICEQLYWNPYYIIGDLTQQSIVEVWNSPKALKLAFPKREDFRDASPCKSCKIFEECYAFPNRCIVDVLKGYGLDNKDFPDPRCVNAPRQISVLIPQ
ncbi:radical SAM protein [Parabacteroides distasonis]|uniref:Radical SAM protein n=2 Tax=Parabacteroides distasonis TaxID=823 RepID=A0A3L7ZM62_PARDI|nr:radical SAM protein [Parabacteroides distasonis]RLT72789.1 radical SAM protein [Parabacteroides distasonis]